MDQGQVQDLVVVLDNDQVANSSIMENSINELQPTEPNVELEQVSKQLPLLSFLFHTYDLDDL